MEEMKVLPRLLGIKNYLPDPTLDVCSILFFLRR